MEAPPQHPDGLPPGTQLGPWRVRGRHSQGTYGTVYRVVQAGDSKDTCLALKLARHPEDPRFEREGELLSRIHHPHVPRLHDRGWWKGHEGLVFPFLVMDWVEGVPLYDWAQAHCSTSRQVLQVLAQLARALEATDAASCVHRDVKGDNVLVDSAGKAVLVDFGSGSYEGARSLTREPLPPGTEPYRSPQALRFQWRFRRRLSARYVATPADDVYALGVTAYRLCTGRYPPPLLAPSEEGADEPLTGEPFVAPGALATVAPELDALIVRMLQDDPGARGTAAQLAMALETAAKKAGPEADSPIVPRPLSGPAALTAPPKHRQRLRLAMSWLVAASVGALIATFVGGSEEPSRPDTDVEPEARSGLADDASRTPASSTLPSSARTGMGLDMPKQPLSGQRRPPCARHQVEIHGGCWREVTRGEPPCGEDAYEWKGACFYPAPAPRRSDTSDAP